MECVHPSVRCVPWPRGNQTYNWVVLAGLRKGPAGNGPGVTSKAHAGAWAAPPGLEPAVLMMAVLRCAETVIDAAKEALPRRG